MTHEKFDKLFEARVEKLREIGRTKGHKYAGDADRLANFKEEGKELDLPPEKVLHVFLNKHLRAIGHYCSTGQNLGEELVENHITDALMYLFLLEGLVKYLQEAEFDAVMTTDSCADF